MLKHAKNFVRRYHLNQIVRLWIIFQYIIRWPGFVSAKHDNPSVIISPFISSDSVQNILVIKLDHIGDAFLSLPAINRMREKFPRAKIHVLCGSWSASLFSDVADTVLTLDYFTAVSAELPTFPANEVIAELSEQVAELRLDIAINLRCQDDTNWVLTLGGKPIAQTILACSDMSYPTSNDSHEVLTIIGQRHITQKFVWMVDSIPVIAGDSTRQSQIRHSSQMTIGVNPGVGTETRQWPVESFITVTSELLDKGFQVILLGGPNDRSVCNQITERLHHPNLINSVASIPIDQFAATVAKMCHAYIGNNTGPTHMVASECVPTVAVYGGVVDPFEWMPVGPYVRVLHQATPCTPCYILTNSECPFHKRCFTDVQPQHVLEQLYQVLGLNQA